MANAPIDADAVIDAEYTPNREDQHDHAVLALMRKDAGVPQIPTYFQTMRPAERIAYAVEMADAMKQIIDAKGLGHKLGRGDDEYVELEAWQTCGALNGIAAKIEWTRRMADAPGDWEARAVLIRTDTGLEIGAAESMCSKKEKRWGYAEDFARRGMAQTRAQSRAFRGQLAWILVLAGYKATPAEEMPGYEPAPPIAPAPSIAPAASTELPPSVDNAKPPKARKASVDQPNPAVPKVATPSAVSAADRNRNAWVGRLTELEEALGPMYADPEQRQSALNERYGVREKRELTGKQMTDYAAWLREQKIEVDAYLAHVEAEAQSIGPAGDFA